MSQSNTDNVTFQVTVVRLTLLLPLSAQDIRVTVGVGDVSKITCSGQLSWHSLTVTWNHPFLFTASPSTPVVIAIYTLPEEVTSMWRKIPLGGQIVTNVGALLKSENGWRCQIPGLSVGLATLLITSKPCNVLIAPNEHDCLSNLRKYDMMLYEYLEEFKSGPCLSAKIELGLASLDLCPLGHTDHTSVLNDLACSFDAKYTQEGDIADLNKAIEIKQARLALCPSGHPEHASALGEFALSLWKYYCIQKNKATLYGLVDIQERWVVLCPPGHPDHTRALGELALSLWEHYNIEGNIADLDRAIEMEEERLDLCPEGHSQHGSSVGNLAIFINARYRKCGNLGDLNKAIHLQEKKLALRPPGHQSHGLALRNLAMFLKDRFNVENDYSDLIRAIELLKAALVTHPVQHRHFAFVAGQLATTILLPFHSSRTRHPPRQSFPLPDEAFETYRLLMRCGPAVSLHLWNATQDWVRDAETHDHPSVLEAYQTSLNMLDHFTSFNSTLDSRHEIMQARVADLANNAFSCAIRHGEFQMAVELLEQGRGILWNQLARFNISMTALQSLGRRERKLGGRFAQLSADLRNHAEGNDDKGMGPYWQVQQEWQVVVDEIRRLNGFSRFLLPPRFEDLQQAAEYGPVIIVNASEHTCDALIVLHDCSPIHVPLPCSLDDVLQLCSDLLDLTQNSYGYGDNRESWVKQMLRDLWSSVVKPIVAVLQNDVQLPLGSRIWWCPTSKFTILPFHAAGPYRNTLKNVMDLYVSSYAPSLSALVRTRDRIRSQRAARDASGVANMVSFAAVGQSRPSASMSLSELPEVEHEIEKIQNEASVSPDVRFETVTGDAATIEGTVQAFHDYRWVHLACHGAQHIDKPFESWFAMRDGKLTLMRIIQERYTDSEFAFLSACHTAVGDRSTPDEVLHLAAGMQFAGFNGVIGTLWRVDDAVAHQVVTRFYKEMFKRPVINFEHAATALNLAVVETAMEVSLEKRIVFVHIGI